MSNPKTYNIGGEMGGVDFDSFDQRALCPKCGGAGKVNHTDRQSRDIRIRFHVCQCGNRFKSVETRK